MRLALDSLEKSGDTIAVTVGPVEVQVVRQDEGVSVYIFDEAKDCVDEMWITFSEAKDRLP